MPGAICLCALGPRDGSMRKHSRWRASASIMRSSQSLTCRATGAICVGGRCALAGCPRLPATSLRTGKVCMVVTESLFVKRRWPNPTALEKQWALTISSTILGDYWWMANDCMSCSVFTCTCVSTRCHLCAYVRASHTLGREHMRSSAHTCT